MSSPGPTDVPSSAIERPRLLAILAHPDDESFGPGGALAHYARLGVEVHLLTMTDGAAGAVDPVMLEGVPGADPGARLAALRRRELEAACEILGATLHLGGYRDSGMAGSPANGHPDSLVRAPLDGVAERIIEHLDALRPQVVLTHDPTGGYFHPDHIRCNEATLRAMRLLAAPEALNEFGLPARGFYTAIPRATVRRMTRMMRLMGRDPRRFGTNGDIDLTRLGIDEADLQVRLDVRHVLSVKEAASACHLSQGGGGALRRLPDPVRRWLQRHERFAQAWPPPEPGLRLHGFFEGLGFEDLV